VSGARTQAIRAAFCRRANLLTALEISLHPRAALPFVIDIVWTSTQIYAE